MVSTFTLVQKFKEIIMVSIYESTRDLEFSPVVKNHERKINPEVIIHVPSNVRSFYNVNTATMSTEVIPRHEAKGAFYTPYIPLTDNEESSQQWNEAKQKILEGLKNDTDTRVTVLKTTNFINSTPEYTQISGKNMIQATTISLLLNMVEITKQLEELKKKYPIAYTLKKKELA